MGGKTYSPGDRLLDYTVKQVDPLPAIAAQLYQLEHLPTGARHIHIAASDSENTFGVTFKTVPSDSTGVAHILEHTVLCGSALYPVRDPFFAMLRRSLSTFMNALTASDWTMYPFATQNEKDFFNLMGIYLDAAFFPRLDRLSFKQEGHRLEFEGNGNGDPAKGNLQFKGVVYNEMKGAMSAPEQVMVRSLLNALYPDITYHHNSGGDPKKIPELTHEQLCAFHRRHYHPSNAFFYTYGNFDLEKQLRFISDKVLSRFDKIDPGTEVPSQPRWQRERLKRYTYPLTADQDPARKAQVCLAWLMADITDSFEVLVLAVMEHVLLGNSASPLRKALIESGMGSALSDGTGFDADNRDTLFACGLKDVDPEDADRIESLILEVLRELVDRGIDRQLVDAALHQIEFQKKEITNTPYPYGIRLLLTLAGGWIHGGDPVRVLNVDDDLEALQRAMAGGGFLEGKIQSYFLDNPHRVRMSLVPDLAQQERERDAVSSELARIKAELSAEAARRIRQDSQALQALQDKEEDVSVLPTLELADIPPTVPSVAATTRSDAGDLFQYQQPTSGIFYFTLACGLGGLPAEHLPWVPFFCHALPRMGTRDQDYAALARRIDTYTGGLALSPQARTPYDGQGQCLPLVTLGSKCLNRNLDPMFAIVEDLLGGFAFRDLKRLQNLLAEYRAALESSVLPSGHRLAISLAARNFHPSAWISEQWQGIHQLRHIKGAMGNAEHGRLPADDLEAIARVLTAIGEHILTPGNLRVALVGEKEPLSSAAARASQLNGRLAETAGSRRSTAGLQSYPVSLTPQLPWEGWNTASTVAFVAQVSVTVGMDHPDAPALAVIARLLRSLYLHREIREKGGAYGGFALYRPEDGLFAFASYRDPQILKTLDAYDGARRFIQSGKYTAEDIKEAILQVCAEIDKPYTPGAAAAKAFMRQLLGLSDEMRRRFKAQLLALGRDSVAEVAGRHFGSAAGERAVAVIAGLEGLQQANQELGEHPLALHPI
jgi:Zn-dependent M16 (insulinase) family peptidase